MFFKKWSQIFQFISVQNRLYTIKHVKCWKTFTNSNAIFCLTDQNRMGYWNNVTRSFLYWMKAFWRKKSTLLSRKLEYHQTIWLILQEGKVKISIHFIGKHFCSKFLVEARNRRHLSPNLSSLNLWSCTCLKFQLLNRICAWVFIAFFFKLVLSFWPHSIRRLRNVNVCSPEPSCPAIILSFLLFVS